MFARTTCFRCCFNRLTTLSHQTSYFKSFSTKRLNLYAILDIPKTATLTDIKHSYYRLAQVYHPDKNSAPDAKEKFAEISQAYETLSDTSKRKVYDSSGMTADEQERGPTDYEDPFAEFFRGRRKESRYKKHESESDPEPEVFRNHERDPEEDWQANAGMKGQDVNLEVHIDFEKAVSGTSVEVKYKKTDNCSSCNGSRHAKGKGGGICTSCNGKGHISYKRGVMTISSVCTKCLGEGKTIRSPCQTCRGRGITQRNASENVTLPKGINSGDFIKIRRKGDIGENGSLHGDLNIKVQVKEDPYYRREGYDVYTLAYINISDAIFGSEATIDTLHGPHKIRIEKGTQNGDHMRIRKMGVTKLAPNNNDKGDHYVEFRVIVPKKLTPEAEKIFESLAQVDGEVDQREMNTKNRYKYQPSGQKKKERRPKYKGKYQDLKFEDFKFIEKDNDFDYSDDDDYKETNYKEEAPYNKEDLREIYEELLMNSDK